MSPQTLRLLGLHLTGYFHVFLHALVGAILLGWGLQVLALMFGDVYNWSLVFIHLFLSLSLLAFYPGQTVWTYRLEDREGRSHTIIGRDPDDDMGTH
jgi:hypothetical protein